MTYTNLYADSVFYGNPNRGNLLGLKRMLMRYGIRTEGIRVAEGEEEVLSFPCILHVGDGFVVATGREDTHIVYIEKGVRKREAWADFKPRWDGLALVKTEGTGCEPDYEKNRREERMEKAPLWGVVLTMCGMLAMAVSHILTTEAPSAMLTSAAMVALAVAGFWFSFLLAEKEAKGSSRIGDKLCRALGESGCGANKTKEGKIWGTLSLSSVGLGYFSAQILALSLLPEAGVFVAALSVVAVLFCPWSIATQWKLKQWCVLCLLVVAVLVLQGGVGIGHLAVVNGSVGLTVKELGIEGRSANLLAAKVLLLMGLCVILAHWLTQGERQRLMARRQKWAFQAFRNEPAVFAAKLKGKAPVKIEEHDVTQRVGIPDAPHRLTVVTSADCPHCQEMKPRIERLAQQQRERLCIDYIMLSDKTDEEVHEFIQRTGISGTPTLLLDGYLLPREYEVEEVFNF